MRIFSPHLKEFFEIPPSAEFFCFKDAQANIVALLDNNGSVVVKYKYDAWGKCHTTVVDSSATTLAELNPFRYRSYYLDTETNLYFLKTRYYDPEIGRFITIDDISYLDPESVNGLNLYAYCLNNPVMMVDSNGCAPKWWQNLLIVGAGVLLIAGLAIATVLTGGTAAGIAGAIFAGALKGALIGAAVGTVVGRAIGYAVGGLDGMWTGMAIGFTGGAVIGAIIGGAIGYTSFVQPGVPFNPNYHSGLPQNGVNPRTIQYGRQRFDPEKVVRNLFETIKKGKIEEKIIVSQKGVVLQGNHRLLMARLFKITIDVVIGGMG